MIDEKAMYAVMEEEGHKRSAVKAALSRLAWSRQIASKAARASLQINDTPAAKIVNTTLEGILTREAVIPFIEEWRAILVPGDYGRPRELIKVNETFKALSDLYLDSNILCAKARPVIQASR